MHVEAGVLDRLDMLGREEHLAARRAIFERPQVLRGARGERAPRPHLARASGKVNNFRATVIKKGSTPRKSRYILHRADLPSRNDV